MGRRILFLFYAATVCIGCVQAQSDTVQRIIAGRSNAAGQLSKPYVILLSVDGFRYDYAEKYHADNLLAFSDSGVRAISMIPSFPTLTFPNHYSIATGLYPAHHGLVNNYFYDPRKGQSYSMRNKNTTRDGSWYGGTPIWVVAEQQSLLTASFYWVGSEAGIQNVYPTYYYNYNDSIPIDRRIQVVYDWLSLPAEKRPHLITFYISDVDHAGHAFGPDAPETGAAVKGVDQTIARLVARIDQLGLPVNYILVADHGMTKVDTEHPLSLPPGIDTMRFVIPRGAELVELYAKKKRYIKKEYQRLKKIEDGFTVYRKRDLPARLHYGEADDRYHRVGDLLLVPHWPRVFALSGSKTNPGAHGFDVATLKDMQATFMAWGPAFRKKLVVDSFENVNVFPVIIRILELNFGGDIDGNDTLARKIVK